MAGIRLQSRTVESHKPTFEIRNRDGATVGYQPLNSIIEYQVTQ